MQLTTDICQRLMFDPVQLRNTVGGSGVGHHILEDSSMFFKEGILYSLRTGPFLVGRWDRGGHCLPRNLQERSMTSD